MKPSEKSLYKLKHVFNLLGLRIIPAYFLEKNKKVFESWHYNACNQTALITGFFLDMVLHTPGLNNSNPFQGSKFKVQLFEGLFTEQNMTSHYNHAYVYVHQANKDLAVAYSFFVDVARISNPTVFASGINLSPNPEAYSSNYKLLSYKELDYKAMLLNQREYYTGKLGIEICKEIDLQLRKLGFDLSNFDWNV